MASSVASAKDGLLKFCERASDGRPIMYYSYILESEKFPGKFYRGFTSDLKQRLQAHNEWK